MEPKTPYYKQYSLSGVRRDKEIPSKKDLPEAFVDLMERMGYKIEDSPNQEKDSISISRGVGTEYVARFDFEEGIFIAKTKEDFGRITTLGLEELATPREVFFEIPETYGGGSMMEKRDIDERIPKFRDYLEKYSFDIEIEYVKCPSVKKRFATKKCGELWMGCISVFPNEPWGEELYRLCERWEDS